jgi:hypothetical protein
MSCVIGLVTDECVWLASDEAACDGNVVIGNGFPKIIERAVQISGSLKSFGIGIGAVGEVGIANALQFFLTVPAINSDESHIVYPDKYIVKELIPAIRTAYTEAGIEDGNAGNDMLIAFMGQLYSVGERLDVIIPKLGFDAIGSGREIALGSMYTTTTMGMDAVDTVHSAMVAADILTAYVRGPYTITKFFPLGVKNDKTHSIL